MLLLLDNLVNYQSLPKETFASDSSLCHIIFVSHRWESESSADPFNFQLAALKKLVREMVLLAELLSDENTGANAVLDRCRKIPFLTRQGTLQAAHLLFRTLCSQRAPEIMSKTKTLSDLILDAVGFWYDFSCLPQGQRNNEEEREFREVLSHGIVELIRSPLVSTLVLRRVGDGYLSRGWCFAESTIASSKDDIAKPILLWPELAGETVPMADLFRNSTAAEQATHCFNAWSDTNAGYSAWEAFELTVKTTSRAFMARMSESEGRYALGEIDSTKVWQSIFADVLVFLSEIFESHFRDLSAILESVLRNHGLECREEQDYILVSLLLLQAITSSKSEGDVSLCHEAIDRFMSSASLLTYRENGRLQWAK